jgi:hypothetical protein
MLMCAAQGAAPAEESMLVLRTVGLFVLRRHGDHRLCAARLSSPTAIREGQAGAQENGIHEVTGSIPVSSTKSSNKLAA